MWNRAGVRPQVCDILEQMARESDPRARVWRGSDRPDNQLGLKVLGTPLGHPAYVQEHLEIIAAEHQQFLDKIPTVPDLQCAWALLLHCGSARANYFLRVVRPDCTVQFAALHDEGLWRCLCSLLDISNDLHSWSDQRQRVSSVVVGWSWAPQCHATRSRVGAYWASWADALHMIHKRHRSVAEEVVAASVAHHLDGVRGFGRVAARRPPSTL